MTTPGPVKKQTILIVDDSPFNRAILQDILSNDFDIVEAQNGKEALSLLEAAHQDIDLILLDLIMPEMDGFEFMQAIHQKDWMDEMPVIMISSENMTIPIEHAYDLGVSDFISRPFDAEILRRRVMNTIMLYAKQKKLLHLVLEQVYEKEQQSGLMVSMLSHIVEFRNGESGPHILHIQKITELFLKYLSQSTDRYPLTPEETSLIILASALHDIGKIAIPSEVLNKPGRLTPEEFAVMKTHTVTGAAILEDLDKIHKEAQLTQVSYQICRWHHERWDGKGYPDGLKENQIPLAAQIVALADVYDALTSERVYKKAIPHQTAVQMILDGQCGAFNPLLLDCLKKMANSLYDELKRCTAIKLTEKAKMNIIAARVLAKLNLKTNRSPL